MTPWQDSPSTSTPLSAANLDAAFAEKADAVATTAALAAKVGTTDARLADARTPTAHTQTASTISDFNTAVDARLVATTPAVTARVTASVTPITTTDVVLVTAPSVTGDGVKRFKISAFCTQIISAAADAYNVKIKADGVQIQFAVAVCTAGTQTNAISMFVSHVPTAGAHTYTFTAVRQAGTGTGTASAGTTQPIEIIVERIS